MTSHVAIIGGGPAGLMAAQVLAETGHHVSVYEAKPSLGRKFLMAGKSGLNLTKREPEALFRDAYREASDWLTPMLSAFGPDQVEGWARDLGQPLFTGSSGRVFPEVMKASPLLRAWLAQLRERGVSFHTRHRWRGWRGDALVFDTLEGDHLTKADATILALGGGSWARLGSDGAWTALLAQRGVEIAPLAPANAAIRVGWSPYMAPHFGSPLKSVKFTCGPYSSRGEAILSEHGLEGGGIYSVSRGIREGETVRLDLKPDLSHEVVAQRLSRPRGKSSLSNHLRRALGLSPLAIALLREVTPNLSLYPEMLAAMVKHLELPTQGLRPMDEAISTAGGVTMQALSPELMLNALPGVFCAGEMLDWEAPTGGYLLTACLSTGAWAGQGAAAYLSKT